MRPFDYYQSQLDRVSRSFAMCIPQLAPPLRDHVALAYLLLRVLDTIEDAPFTDPIVQQQQFSRLRRFLVVPPARADIEAFTRAFPAQLTGAERDLVADTAVLLQDAYELDPAVRAAMFGAIDRMGEGMAAYTRRGLPLRLVDLEDVTRYCCFVAGLVGEMLTKLWALSSGQRGPAMALAYHFGIFLQTVNILKDEEEDAACGRFYVPDRRDVLASLRTHSLGALQYIQSLPANERGYRVFCSWSLMMGATTISALDGPKQSRRDETAALLTRTADIAHDNAALARLLAELMPRLPDPQVGVRRPKPESHEWFRASLDAPLSDYELSKLGIYLRSSAAAS